MTDRQLPHPTTNADEYLFAMVVELRALNRSLAQLLKSEMRPATDEVELKEPVARPQPAKRTRKK